MRGRYRTIKPDNIARRAKDLEAVGQKEDALQTLYDFVTSRRIRDAEAADLEPIGMLLVEMGTNQRNGKLVKDGLHQFKKAIQSTDEGLKITERVCKHFLEVAEKKLASVEVDAGAAAAKEEKKSAAAAAAAQKVLETFDEDEDEDVSEEGEDGAHFSISPEDILLSAVSMDDTTDRSNRQLVVPWLRFLWESYRTALDILRNNCKLEEGYCFVCQHAFHFCTKYDRKMEFRRLCEMLRSHLQTVSQRPNEKYQVVNPVDLSNPDTLQRYLEVRFSQLSASVHLELWQEAFRSIEDVHTLMTLTKRQPKPAMLMTYYENLAKVFSVSGDSLFHAAACEKYFSLLLKSPISTEEQKKHFASLKLISALTVPETGSGSDDFNRRKVRRLASLLSMGSTPTRESLLEQAMGSQTMLYADDLLRTLYQALEVNFHPLSFAKTVKPLFKAIEAKPEYQSYVVPLRKVAIDRIFREVSQMYETLQLDFLVRLCNFDGGFHVTGLEVQRLLLQAASKKVLSVRIDQAAGVVIFKSEPFGESLENRNSSTLAEKVTSVTSAASVQLTPSEFVRFQLSNLAKTLSESVKLIDVRETKQVDRDLKDRSLARANEEFENERKQVIERFTRISHRKEELAELRKKEAERSAKERLEKQMNAKHVEQERAEKEAIRRKQEKLQWEIEQKKLEDKKKMIEEVNKKGIIEIKPEDAKDMDEDKLHTLQVQKLEEDKMTTEKLMNKVAQRNDYLERAERQYQLGLLKKQEAKEMAEEKNQYETVKKEYIEKAHKAHEHDIAIRNRLSRIAGDYPKYVTIAQEEQNKAYERMKAISDEKYESEKAIRIQQYIEQKKQEFLEEQQRRKQEAVEKRKREEEERRVAAAQEKRRRELEEAQMRRDPGRRQYMELMEKSKSGRMTFREKMILKKLKAKYA